MTPQDVIREVQENAAEYLEHVQDPAAMVAGILASKVISLTEYVSYLEKRIQNANTNPRY